MHWPGQGGLGKPSRVASVWVHYTDDVKVMGLGKQELGDAPDVLVQGTGDNAYKDSGV